MPLGRRNQLKDPLRTWRKSQKLSSPFMMGFWHDRDQDIIDRLDQAAKRLKEKRAAQLQDNKEDDTAIPATSNLERSCSLCNEPIGHHVLTMHQGNPAGYPEGCHSQQFQLTLDRVPPKIVHLFPEVSPQTLAAPSPRNSSQLLSKVEFSCQDVHRSASQGIPGDDCNDNSAKSCAEETVTQKKFEVTPAQLKTGPPKLKHNKNIQSLQCIINFIYLQKTHTYRLSEQTLPVPV